jgi:hypothetical protein
MDQEKSYLAGRGEETKRRRTKGEVVRIERRRGR